MFCHRLAIRNEACLPYRLGQLYLECSEPQFESFGGQKKVAESVTVCNCCLQTASGHL